MINEKKIKNIFTEGPVAPAFITESIQKHQSKTNIGAHSIFLGQVRKDEVDGKQVTAIEYTTYQEMALEKMQTIREAVFSAYPLTCLHVYHSLGIVPAGEICLFVFASSAHRKAAMEACDKVVERLKAELPIWGKELFEDDSFQWKVNR